MNLSIWLSSIDKITTAYREAFGDLSVDQLNYKPASDVWSIAQNIDHVMTVNNSYFPVIQRLRSGKHKVPFISKINVLVRYFGNMILKSVQPEETKKVKTFPIWEPAKSTFSVDILDKFEKCQSDLKKLISENQDLLEKRAVISSPANKFIVYKLETAFEIIIAHERRHLQKSRAIKEMEGFPVAS